MGAKNREEGVEEEGEEAVSTEGQATPGCGQEAMENEALGGDG